MAERERGREGERERGREGERERGREGEMELYTLHVVVRIKYITNDLKRS